MPFPSLLRLLWRSAAGNPGLTLLSLLTLAVAVGATVAIFTVVNAVLLRPLPFPDSERLVVLRHAAPQLGPLDDLPMSDALHFLYAEHSRTLDGVVRRSATWRSASPIRTTRSECRQPASPRRSSTCCGRRRASAARSRPRRTGRALRRWSCSATGCGGAGSARIPASWGGSWRSIASASRSWGSCPRVFAFPRPETALWRPMGLDPENVRLGFFGLNGVARMAGGASLEQVRAELGAMLSNLEELLPDQPGALVMAREFRPLIVPLSGRGWSATSRRRCGYCWARSGFCC